ncbi:MAG TPA: hypothetical protein EYO07_04230 [Candidatus Marinimicrobia bacterium]|nr:hypothetical protein [Candidatus Neomarinimicrobiota bacterium]
MINIYKKLLLFLLVILMPMFTPAQIESTDYFTPGEEKTELMIIVHVWGEVNNPGKFVVRDGTSLVDILSEAGGPTRYANLKNVYIAHKRDQVEHIEIHDLKKYVEEEKTDLPSILPGDVIVVKRNAMGLGLELGQLTSQLAVVLNTILIIISISNL